MEERIKLLLFLFKEVEKKLNERIFSPGSISFSNETLKHQGIKSIKEFEVGFQVDSVVGNLGETKKNIILFYKE